MLVDMAEQVMETTVANLPASKERLDVYRKAQQADPVCSLLTSYCKDGWPNKNSVDPQTKPYWDSQGELTIGENILMYGSRIVVPEILREVTLHKLHRGHQGIVRSRLRAQTSVWWPGISKQLSDLVKKCPECARDTRPNK